MNLDDISEVLATHSGRDKFLRLLTYLGKLGTGITTSQNIALKSQIFASQISGSRVILRLLDDIPLINYVIGYGWGKEVGQRSTQSNVDSGSRWHFSIVFRPFILTLGTRLANQICQSTTKLGGHNLLSDRTCLLGWREETFVDKRSIVGRCYNLVLDYLSLPFFSQVRIVRHEQISYTNSISTFHFTIFSHQME